MSDYSLYDEAGILERTGVPPSQYVLLAALRGDPSDNLPGVPGVGEKTAAKLLNKYGDLDGIFAHLDEQTPKLRENLAANEELARSQRPDHPARARRAARRGRGPLDAGRVGPRHRGGHLRALRDEDGLAAHGGAPRCRRAGRAGRRQRGPGPQGGRWPATAASGTAIGPTPAPAPTFELRDVALPTTATEITKHLTELGAGRLALAARWNGMPGRSDLVALVIVATEGDEAGLGVLVPGDRLGAASVVARSSTTS